MQEGDTGDEMYVFLAAIPGTDPLVVWRGVSPRTVWMLMG